jgi:hypothetical protein
MTVVGVLGTDLEQATPGEGEGGMPDVACPAEEAANGQGYGRSPEATFSCHGLECS